MVSIPRFVIAAVMLQLGLGSSLCAQAAAESYKTGRVLMDSNKADAAVKAFEKAIALDDKISDYHLWLGNAVGSVARNASVLRQPFLARRVKSEFERAVQLDPASVNAREGLVSFYLEAPGIMGGSVAKAREQADGIAKVNAMRGHFARARVAENQKDTATVEREYRTAFEENPDSSIAMTTFAGALAAGNRGDEAFTVVDKYLARHPGDVLATFWIGRLAAITGKQLERGEKALHAVLESPNLGTGPNQPALFAIHFRLGDIAAKRGDKTTARKEYEKSIELNSKFDGAKKALKAL
jgi:tetratricopeptide (TPR) repeat protein